MLFKTYSNSTLTPSGARAFTARINTADVDRDLEVLDPAGMDASEFLRNPAIFWNHDYNKPVGKALMIARAPDGWLSPAQVALRPDGFVGDFFPDYAWAMIRQGIVRGVSTGFEIVEARSPAAEDRKRYGPDVERIISRWKLLEWSVAPLQSNTEAVITAVGKGLITRAIAIKAYPTLEIPREDRPDGRRVVIIPCRLRNPGLVYSTLDMMLGKCPDPPARRLNPEVR